MIPTISGILAVDRDRFDRITDWIGIPLGILAIVVLVVLDLRRESDHPVGRFQALASVLVVAAASAVILVRFVVLSG